MYAKGHCSMKVCCIFVLTHVTGSLPSDSQHNVKGDKYRNWRRYASHRDDMNQRMSLLEV